MNVSNISSSALNAIASQQTGDAMGIKVLKKALDVQAQSAMQLISALPETKPAQNLPSNLGQNINVTA